jgi:hypothetical protein
VPEPATMGVMGLIGLSMAGATTQGMRTE